MIWDFFQNQILGMKWLNVLIGDGLSAIGIDIQSRLGGSLQFFLYDTIKIMVLLCVLIFGISFIQSYFPPEKTRERLGRVNGLAANTGAALLGTLTPFCACSSIPLFMGFTGAGLPVGVTFSFDFLPLGGPGIPSFDHQHFGGKAAIAYVVVGLILAVVSGSILEKMGMERYVEDFVKQAAVGNAAVPEMSRKDRITFAKTQVKEIFHRVYAYILIGVAIGALIHNWIPQEWIEAVLGDGNPFSVILATVAGVPMYADIFGTIPIAEALFAKGVGIGTVMAFMMGVTALSLPSMILLKKVVKMPLLLAFAGIVTAGIIIIGYLFNAIQVLLI